MALAISGLEGGAEGCLFGRDGAVGVLYAGGGGSLLIRRLLKADVGAGAGEGAACREELFKDDSAGIKAMIWS